jgi:hypothetical protein
VKKFPGSEKLTSGRISVKELLKMVWNLGQRGLDMFNKQKERQSPMGQVKNAFGAGNKNEKISRFKKANKWKDFI